MVCGSKHPDLQPCMDVLARMHFGFHVAGVPRVGRARNRTARTPKPRFRQDAGLGCLRMRLFDESIKLCISPSLPSSLLNSSLSQAVVRDTAGGGNVSRGTRTASGRPFEALGIRMMRPRTDRIDACGDGEQGGPGQFMDTGGVPVFWHKGGSRAPAPCGQGGAWEPPGLKMLDGQQATPAHACKGHPSFRMGAPWPRIRSESV